MKQLILFSAILISTVFPAAISFELQEKIRQLSPDDIIEIQIYFKQKFEKEALINLSYREKVAYLKAQSIQSQSAVLRQLSEKRASKVESFWAGNLIVATVKISEIQDFFQFDEIIYLDIVRTYQIELPIEGIDQEIEWNIQKIRAPEVWTLGYTGKEVVIGFIDTGVDATHQDIKNQRREYDSWYDATTNGDSLNPYDDYGHGTHVVGIACGRNGIGVAPDAKWVMVRAFVGGEGSSKDIHRAFDWLAGLEEPPQIISNSWGSWNIINLEFWQDLETIRALGIIPVFANGNSGALGPSTPGNFPLVIGVGATDKNDSLGYFSSIGRAPNQEPWTNSKYWPYQEWNLLKPDLCAPGVSVRSSVPGNGYKKWSGTSMACPHVAGAIALILEKNPTLDFKSVYWLLAQNARHISYFNQMPNDRYGWGRIDIYQTINKVPDYEIKETIICQNFPNPFNEYTIITFQLKHPIKATLKIYDQAGRLIKTFFERQSLKKGHYCFNWDGRDNDNQEVASGIYFCLLRIGKTQQVIKMIYLAKKRK